MIKAVQTTVYRVRYKSKHGPKRYSTFPTLNAAASKVAWWMIFDKYRDPNSGISLAPYNPPVECDCLSQNGSWDDHKGYDACPLHDRQDGYFAIVHERLVRWIKTEAEATE